MTKAQLGNVQDDVHVGCTSENRMRDEPGPWEKGLDKPGPENSHCPLGKHVSKQDVFDASAVIPFQIIHFLLQSSHLVSQVGDQALMELDLLLETTFNFRSDTQDPQVVSVHTCLSEML